MIFKIDDFFAESKQWKLFKPKSGSLQRDYCYVLDIMFNAEDNIQIGFCCGYDENVINAMKEALNTGIFQPIECSWNYVCLDL